VATGRKVGLVQAAFHDPELLVLDEPTDGVDPLGRAEIRRLLGEERARGATLLLNSHLLSETERMCDRIAILAGGRIVREGSVRELCGNAGAWRARFAADAPTAQAASELSAHGFKAQQDGSYRVLAATADELDAKLVAARAAGVLLVELHPEAKDLEAVLQEAVLP